MHIFIKFYNFTGGSSLSITDQMICAGKEGTVLSGCHGDSGGPYVCRNSAGRYVLQGAVSWGSSRCSASELYTVFARVAQFRNWIDQNIGGMQTSSMCPMSPVMMCPCQFVRLSPYTQGPERLLRVSRKC